MVQENAVVIKVEGASAWVETQRQSACASCAVNKGCGSAVLSQALGRKRNIVRVEHSEALQVGDRVVLGMDDAAFVKGSFAVYIVPLLLMFVMAVIGQTFASALGSESEGLTILFAGLGMVLGFYWLKRFSKRNRCNSDYHPRVIQKI